MTSTPQDRLRPFTDTAMIAGYADRPARQVPGFADLHRMAVSLLDEGASRTGSILVLGAGGGLELKAFATARPDWQLTGVDPSGPMLDIARQTLGPLAGGVDLIEGYIAAAPNGPFDGATCILTLHFLDRAERIEALRALYDRLAPGARLVVAHHSFAPEHGPLWVKRYAAYTAMPSADGLLRLPILSPADDEAMLLEAGFSDVALFYGGLTFRGWVGTR